MLSKQPVKDNNMLCKTKSKVHLYFVSIDKVVHMLTLGAVPSTPLSPIWKQQNSSDKLRSQNVFTRKFIHHENQTTCTVPLLSRSTLSPWWAPQPGTASLLNFAFLTEPFHLRFFLTLRLLCLTVLVLGALLSSFLEEALYKCSIWMRWM